MHRIPAYTFIAFTFMAFTFSGIAGQVVHEIREVVIEGESVQNAIQQQKEAGPSTLVISSLDLNNLGHKTAGDVLKRLPGMVVDGPPSFYRNIMMAGLDKEFQAVLINGERPGGGEDYRDFKLDRLPVEMIDKIEVVYNPPASMGADATIGAVDIRIKDAPAKRIMNMDLALDHTSTKSGVNPEASLTYGNKWNKWAVFGNLNMNRFQRRNVAYLEDTAIQGSETEDLDVRIHGFTGTLVYNPDPVSHWKLQSVYTNYRENLLFQADVNRRSQGGLSARADSADDLKNRILHSHTLAYSHEKDKSSWYSGFTFAQHYDLKDKQRYREKTESVEYSYEDEFQRNTDMVFKSEYTRKNSGISWKNEIKAGIRLSSLNRIYDRLVYTREMGHMFWDQVEDNSYNLSEYRAGAFIADELWIGKLWISPALRFDSDRGEYSTMADSSGNLDYLNFNPSLHTKYSPGENFHLKTGIARQMARPPFNAMVPIDKIKNKKRTIERGNPELVPSRAWNFSMGAEKYFRESGYVSLRGFYSVLRNVIEQREIGIDDNYGYRIYQPVNVDSGKIWGIELGTRLGLLHSTGNELVVAGNLSWLGSEVRDPATGNLRRLNLQPEWIVNGSLDYFNTRLKFRCTIGMNYITERRTASTQNEGLLINDMVQAPFIQWDARIKYYFSSWGSVYLNGINLFGETMEFTQGIVSESHLIGRNLVLGLSLNF